MKKTLSIVLAVVMVLAVFTACGSNGEDSADNSVVGTWKATQVEAAGVQVSLEDFAQSTGTELAISIELRADGTFSMSMNDEVQGEGTYEVKGNTVALTADGATLNATLEDGKMTIDASGSKVILEK